MSHAYVDRLSKQEDVETMARHVQAGEVRAVARVITWLENREPTGTAVLKQLAPPEQRATVLGITGYPGTGKSTMIDQLITAYRRVGKTVGVLAVDISSPLTGGAVLGDRVRMQRHADDPGVYIRSMATRGQSGGLARATRDALQVLEAAAFDVILIETVGVGQSDIEVVSVAGTVIALVAPGLGDAVQAMKAGLLEVANIVVVNKGDRDGADAAVRDLREWYPHVLRTVAVKGEGIPELLAMIAEQQRLQDLAHAPNGQTGVRLRGS